MFYRPYVHVLWMALLGSAIVASPGFGAESEADLLATLGSDDAPFFDKTQACKQLAVVGTETAVPVLAKLLDDEKLAHYARYALEPIPSPKVDEVLGQALKTIKGRRLIGLITSIANRDRPESIGPLAEKLDDPDRAVATAAAHAIARLGTPQACEILGKRLSAEFAPACLVCGKTLARQGSTMEARALLIDVSEQADAPKHVRLAAMLQAIELQGSEGRDMLAAALASDDRHTFNMALRTARLLKPTDASGAVLGAMKDGDPDRVAPLITLIGDLGDPIGLPAVVVAVKSDDPAVRIAAIGALATLGNAEHVSLLVDAAMDESEEVATQAQESLSSLAGDDVDRAVLALLDDKTRRAPVIRLIGQRRITAAVPKLIAMIDGPNQLDVVAALGGTVSLDELDVLGKRLQDDSEELRLAVRQAIHAACYRMPNRDATAAKLAGYLADAPEETVAFVMDELRTLGGVKALALVAEAVESGDELSIEYATQALGAWLDTSAAGVLLKLAKSEGDSKYGIRGMRGYIRLARQFSMPEEQRARICRTALATAARDAEKVLVLEVLKRYPSVESLRIAVEAGKTPSLKSQAAAAAILIAEQVGGKRADVESLLAQVGQDPVDVEIIKAQYGAGEKQKDVTKTLRRHVRKLPMIALPTPKYNTVFGGDPARGVPKQLTIQYRINGKPGEATFAENATIVLPMPK